MKNKGIYFPGLNGLRAIAALLVFIAHNETVKNIRGISNFNNTRLFSIAGDAGVSLFFCISGFLITSLLFAEIDKTTTINVKDFYIRRVLRIWPLYCLILIVTLLIIPNIVTVKGFNLENKITPAGFTLYLFFLPYVANALFMINFIAAILWSVGVEETFYLIWPLLLKSRKQIHPGFFSMLLFIFLLIKFTIDYLALNTNGFGALATIFDHLRLECMITGAAFAYCFKVKPKLLAPLLNNYTFAFTLSALLIYLLIGFNAVYQYLSPLFVHISDPVIYSIICCIVIVNAISKKAIYTLLEYKPIYELGKISYGIYLYHLICLMLSIMLFDKLSLSNVNGLIFCAFALTSTILVSFISYYAFEIKFLRLKANFTHIKSGEAVRK